VKSFYYCKALHYGGNESSDTSCNRIIVSQPPARSKHPKWLPLGDDRTKIPSVLSNGEWDEPTTVVLHEGAILRFVGLSFISVWLCTLTIISFLNQHFSRTIWMYFLKSWLSIFQGMVKFGFVHQG
jgi:hypothetical protein